MPVASIGRYEINYREEGEGVPVVMIHGLAGDLSAWTPQVAALRDRFRVITFDNRGAGKSTQIDEPVSTHDLARDTIALMEHLKIDSAHIVGRSMGGAIAQIVALEQPALVRSLVLCASFAKLDPLGERVLTNMRQVLEWRGDWGDHARHSIANFVGSDFFNREREQIARIEALIGGETRLPACYVRQNFACLDHDTLTRLGEISCPTLIMGGSQDPICSPTATGWMSDGIARSRTVMFEGCSHFFLMEQPQMFMRELSAWLDGGYKAVSDHVT
ncbi:alpha/beta fold hydrolase [Aurantimonas sp. VKM B-3413]|uniref:alpha/beta fold hydrolase n=1 Tax=Aurantimonas sp. VKM B-3413 TaxID=2779401 RepID=UPI001E4E05A7|nr:alpha/beta hydrolase [Aurantimonas sp. VKM B-3413]MCB8839782.1 alpha/beta hydrolase [Aurantimonas sp. VKM B-3413]